MSHKDRDLELKQTHTNSYSHVPSNVYTHHSSDENKDSKDGKDGMKVIIVNDSYDENTHPKSIRIEHKYHDGTINSTETIDIPTFCGNPIMIIPEGWAIFILIMNIIFPGIGTALFYYIWRYSKTGDCCAPFSCNTMTWRGLGFAQLLLTPLLIGYIWSIYTGVQAVIFSKYFGQPLVIQGEDVYINIVKLETIDTNIKTGIKV